MCNSLSKLGGALIQQFVILGFGSLATSTAFLGGGILLVIVLACLGAAPSLDAQFIPLVQNKLKGKLLKSNMSAISATIMGGQTKPKKEAIFFL